MLNNYMWFYYTIFFFCFVVLYVGTIYRKEIYFYIFALIILISIAAFRSPSSNNDYKEYVYYYNNLSSLTLQQVEPTFIVIANISKVVFGSPIGLFIIYSILGVSLKGLAFFKLTKFYLLSLLLYVSFYFLLHEMTQIRVGVASAILLLSIPFMYDRKLWIFFLLCIVGICFHYSFLAFPLCYFLDTKKLNVKIYLIVIGCGIVARLLSISPLTLISTLNLEAVFPKIQGYQLLLAQDVNSRINLFDKLFLLRVLILLFFIWKWHVIYKYNQYAVILIKLYAISVIMYIVLSDLPVVGIRMRELFGIVEVILIPLSLYVIKPRYVSVLITVIFALVMLSIELINTQLVKSYF
ncbi:MAG: EpsG family protein [Rickettsiales bacterium]|nr:MAG: EpsG family protein [Rickettsiales bacterium]